MKYNAPLWRVRDSPYEKRVIFIRSMRLYKDNLNDSNVFYLVGIAIAATILVLSEIYSEINKKCYLLLRLTALHHFILYSTFHHR